MQTQAALFGSIQKFIQTDSIIRRLLGPEASFCRQPLTASIAKTESTNVAPHDQCHGIEGDARASGGLVFCWHR